MSDTSESSLPTNVRVLLPGVPARSSRGYLGFCAICAVSLGDDWLIFDTGQHGDRLLLLEAMENAHIEREQVKYVVLSHLHHDHVLNLPLFPHALVLVSARELSYARAVIAGKKTDTFIPDCLEALLAGRTIRTYDDTLDIDAHLHLFHVPGHTPGCTALRIEGQPPVVLCGDALKNSWELITRDPGLVLGSREDARNSISLLAEQNAILVPGHDRPFKLIDGKVHPITSFSWSLTLDLYPRERNLRVVDIHQPISDTAPGTAG